MAHEDNVYVTWTCELCTSVSGHLLITDMLLCDCQSFIKESYLLTYLHRHILIALSNIEYRPKKSP